MEDTIKLWFKEGYTDFDSSDGLNRNDPFELKRLNIVVGANNSGKSRFMREFGYCLSNGELDIQLTKYFERILRRVHVSFKDISSISLDLENLNITGHGLILKKIEDAKAKILETVTIYENFTKDSVIIFRQGDEISKKIHESMGSDKSRFRVESLELIESLNDLLSSMSYLNFSSYNIFYVHSLRRLGSFPNSV